MDLYPSLSVHEPRHRRRPTEHGRSGKGISRAQGIEGGRGGCVPHMSSDRLDAPGLVRRYASTAR
jgi:hypothetical protein